MSVLYAYNNIWLLNEVSSVRIFVTNLLVILHPIVIDG